MQFCQLLNHIGAILGISNAKPLACSVKNLAGCLASLYEVVDHQGDKELALQILNVLGVAEELLKVSFAMLEIVGGEAPEVHGNGGGVGDADPLAVVVEILHNAIVTLYLRALNHRGEMMGLLVVLTDSTAYGSAFAEGVINAEAHHCILARTALWEFTEEFTHNLESVAVVKVIAVQYSKGFANNILAHHDSVVGAPRLLTTFGNGKAFRQSVEALEAQLAGNVVLILCQNLIAELFLKVLADNPNDFAKTGLNGIVDAVVHDGLALRAQSV